MTEVTLPPERSAFPRFLTVLASDVPRRRVRLLQWLIASLVYLGAAVLLVVGVFQGWMHAMSLLQWAAFVGLVLLVGYIALRSGWTERFQDPSLTVWQLSMGVIAVNWGYVICGPMRSSALLPLMVIFAFGAFQLRWRQIAFVTVLAIVSLVAAIALLRAHPATPARLGPVDPLQVDLNNLMMIVVVLPALAIIAGRLSGLRQKLRDQRRVIEDAMAELERLAVNDELTLLPNRRSMLALLASSLAQAKRGIAPFCIALIDIDNFKQINDRLGHAAGDTALRNFARLGRAAIRETDVLGRWGGEEFLLVVPGGSRETAQAVLRRISSATRDGALPTQVVTFSAGVAAQRDGETTEQLLARADEAMYAAKHAGRDGVVLAS